jgi:Acetyltransferase (GNAT) domain
MQVIAFDLGEADRRQRYDDLFAACPHAFIQQSTFWADIIRDLGPDQPIFLLANDEGRDVGGLPLYLYRGRPGSILTSVPQAGPLGGVFCRADSDRGPVYAALLGEAESIARANGCLALTIITNPFADDIELYQRHWHPSSVFENFTQVVPLDIAVRGGQFILPNNKKNNPAATIRKAELAGFSTKLCTTEREFKEWYSIHDLRARAIGVKPLNGRLVELIWGDLGRKGFSFLQLVMAEDQIAAGSLFILHRDTCDVYAVSMSNDHAPHAPNYLATKAAMLEMAGRGVKFMNWQSSPSRSDGVYKFKRQWGSQERLYYFLTKTYCDDAIILDLGKEGVQREFPDHFLVPFGVFDSHTLAGRYAKEG